MNECVLRAPNRRRRRRRRRLESRDATRRLDRSTARTVRDSRVPTHARTRAVDRSIDRARLSRLHRRRRPAADERMWVRAPRHPKNTRALCTHTNPSRCVSYVTPSSTNARSNRIESNRIESNRIESINTFTRDFTSSSSSSASASASASDGHPSSCQPTSLRAPSSTVHDSPIRPPPPGRAWCTSCGRVSSIIERDDDGGGSRARASVGRSVGPSVRRSSVARLGRSFSTRAHRHPSIILPSRSIGGAQSTR